MRRGIVSVVAISMVLGIGSVAHADTWEVVRRDPQRTAASLGTLFKGPPVPVWRAYMGGRPGPATAAFVSGSSSVVAISGGRVTRRDLVTQAAVWKSEPLGDPGVVGLADLNGDGTAEIVVRTTPAAVVLDYATGATLWRSPKASFQFVATPRVTDIDGDGVADVYVDECTGCAKNGPMQAGAYSFKNGFAAPITLWERPVAGGPVPTNSGTDSVWDFDGDGVKEVALGSYNELVLLSGATGKAIATLKHPTSDLFFREAGSVAAELDGQPGQELVAIQSQGTAGFAGPPGVAVFKVTPSTGAWNVLWTASTGGYDAELAASSESVSDLDGDSLAEVVISFRPSATAGSWTTRVLDGKTGAIRTELADARFEGALELDGQPGGELVVATPGGLRVWKLSSTGLAALTNTLPGVRVMTWNDGVLNGHGPHSRVAARLVQPGKPACLLVGEPGAGVDFGKLSGVDAFKNARCVAVSNGAWVAGPVYTPLLGEITQLFSAGFSTRPYEQVAMGTGAGTLEVLDSAMNVTNGLIQLFGQRVGTIVGGNTKGMLGHNLIGEDAAGPFVVLPYTPAGTLVGDAALAGWIVPPWPRWTQAALGSPAIIDLGGPANNAVVGVEGTSLVARAAAGGGVVGKVDLGSGTPIGTPLPLRTGNALRVGIDWRVTGNQAVQHAVDFSTQTEPWTAEPVAYGGFWGSAVADLDGNGSDEWYSMYGPLFRRDVATGAVSAAAVSTTYSLPIAANFSGAGAELLLQSGFGGPILVNSGLAAVWSGSAQEPMNVAHGTRTVCSGGARFVTPALNSAWLRAYDGKTGAVLVERLLAEGGAYVSVAAAEAAGKKPGFLSHASSVASAGNVPVVLVGSTDGRLYAVEACALDVLWSLDFGVPVGEPSVGDYDGDGADEIVVGTSAGWVVGVDHPSLPAPLGVWLGNTQSSGDLSLSVGQQVNASWPAVPGADSYEIALVSPDETAVWDPPYRKVTGLSAMVALGEGLADRPYRIAVRAVGAAGRSADVLSQVVNIHDAQPPNVQVAPTTANGQISVTLTASDDLALDHFVVWWNLKEASEQSYVADGLLSGKQGSGIANWVVPESVRGRAIELAVEVVDSGGNASSQVLNAQVEVDGSVVFSGASSVGQPSSGPLDVPGGPTDREDGAAAEAGACSASAPTPSSSWVAAVLAALAAGLRRRRH